jgi:orotidine-5'-phosphate decarboxylase
MSTNTPIFCAVDKPDLEAAIKLCDVIQKTGIGIKLGLEFFNSLGVEGVKKIQNTFPEIPVFLDLKYYDIPNTVAGAVRAISTNIKPAYLNVHASGGLKMMKAAKEACEPDTKLLAVTILTSFDEQGMSEAGYKDNIRERVVGMAKLTQKAGLDGIVCSSHEIEIIRQECGENFILMVPGIRPAGSASGDQKRIMTPIEAIEKGATHLVIGRPISQADNPLKATQNILASLET